MNGPLMIGREVMVSSCDDCPLLAEGCYCLHPDGDVGSIYDEPDYPALPQGCPLRQCPLHVRLVVPR